MKSGCCAGRRPIGADGIPALDALPLSALTASPAFKHVLAKGWIRTLLRFTSAPECLPELSPTSARSTALTPTAQGQLHRLRIACRYDQSDHRRRRLDRLQRRLPDRGRLRRRRRQNLVRRRCRRRDARHDHGETLGQRHKAQSRARAENRRRTRRPYRRRACRRHRHHRQARRSARHGAVRTAHHAGAGALHRRQGLGDAGWRVADGEYGRRTSRFRC